MKEKIGSISKKLDERKENSSRKKTAEELLLREWYVLEGEFTGYMPEYPDVPDDIRNLHTVKFHDSWWNKNKILQWIADVLKNVLNLPVYEKLNETEKKDLSHYIRSALWPRRGTPSPFPLIITPKEVQIGDYSHRFDDGSPESQFRVVTLENRIQTNPAFHLNDQAAVDVLTKKLAPIIKNTFPRCYVNRAQLVMLMQKQKGSIFSQLPRDVAKIVAVYAEPRVIRPK